VMQITRVSVGNKRFHENSHPKAEISTREKLIKSTPILTLLVILMGSQLIPQSRSTTSTPTGPNVDEVIFVFPPKSSLDWQKENLKAGLIDMIPNVYTLSAAQELNATSGVNLSISPGSSISSCLFFNCRLSPLDDPAVRKAISYLVDREYISKTLLKGLAQPEDSFIPSYSSEWTNSNASAEAYDAEAAANILDKAGYQINNETGTRIDPETRDPLRELHILTPEVEDSPGLWAIGNVTANNLNAIGIPAKHLSLPSYEYLERIMNKRNFDMCAADSYIGYNAFGLYSLLHSSQDRNWTAAYPGTHDQILDTQLQKLWSGIKKSDVVDAAQAAQSRIAELIPYVPVCSPCLATAVSSQYFGLVNEPGIGVPNIWTYMNVSEAGAPLGGRFVAVVEGNVTSLNPLTANNTSALSVLHLLYIPLLEVDPKTLQETPMLAETWETQPWTTESGESGMKITFKLRDDLLWQDGVPFNSSDVKFCINYLKSNNIGLYREALKSLVRVETPDETAIQIYLNSTGYKYLYYFAGMTFLPEHIWKNVTDYKAFTPWNVPNPLVKGMTCLIGQGPFEFMQGDLRNYVKLVWNPLYLMKNPNKPELVTRTSSTQSISKGDQVTYTYTVKNFTSQILNEPDSHFRFSLRSNNGTLILQKETLLNNGKYEAQLNTTKLDAGNYVCEFNALPYGTNTFTIVINQPQPTPNPSPTPTQQDSGNKVPYPIEAILTGTLLPISILIYRRKKKTS
jgi:ABC-type transport system substrate-binding protein